MSFETRDTDRNPAEAGRSGPPLKLIGFLIVLAAVVVFVLQNTQTATINFLWFDGTPPVAAVIGVSALAGIVLARLAGWLWRRRRETADERD